MKHPYPLYLGNEPYVPNTDLVVTDKYDGKILARVPLADAHCIQQAIELAEKARAPLQAMAAFERRAVLLSCVEGLEINKAEFVDTLCAESGKPIRDARNEFLRCMETFRTAAEESVRLKGEVIPLDFSASSRGYYGQWKRFPVGVCSFISPFNFPLNLVAHKVAPAIAVGCPFVLKPASSTPLSALLLGRVLAQAGLPKGAFSILPCHREGAELFTTDERFRLLSFTGSPAVGWELKKKAGRKKVVLELGGNAACLIDEDWDIADAVSRVVVGGFAQSGQSCISVQRVFVHENKYDVFREQFTEAVKKIPVGDPKKEETLVGPLISEEAAKRLESWISSAKKAGAKILTGGNRSGAMLEPTVLEGVPSDHALVTEEAFGPVVVLSRVKNFADGLSRINDSKFGLQAGVFTRDLYKVHLAWETLEVGGVIAGDVPTWRADPMPYGGVKESGLGREGVRYAMDEMTEIRLLAVRPISK
jgi:acyl-CoA reductase-like NAD-dependent aldehyde dehydrogenase